MRVGMMKKKKRMMVAHRTAAKSLVTINNYEGRNYCPETEGTLYGTIETVKELSD